MANIKARDEGGNVVELKAIGTGTTADPFEYVSTTRTNILTAIGTDATSVTQPAGGAGVRGWLSGLFVKTTDIITGLGTDTSSATQTTGGTGVRGWLSGLFLQVSAIVTGLGTDATSASQLVGGNGVLGWLSGLFVKVTEAIASLGTDATSATQLAGGTGVRGWLSGLLVKVTDIFAAIGTDATPATQLTGGAGIRGWLSSIFVKVTELITATSNAGKASSISIDSVVTSTTGANFVTLAAGACTEIVLNNAESSAVDIRYQRGGGGDSMLIPAGAIAVIEGLTNSSNVGIRRADQSNTQVTISFERKTR